MPLQGDYIMKKKRLNVDVDEEFVESVVHEFRKNEEKRTENADEC